MKVVGVLSDDWVSNYSKPMKVSEVRRFKRKHEKIWNIVYFERKYNFLELIIKRLANG